MTHKIFKSMMAAMLAVLLAALVIIAGCFYDYFATVQENQLSDELSLAAGGVESSGKDYLAVLASNHYRLTWVAADGTVLYDTQADAAQMENHAEREEIRQALQNGTGSSSRYSATLLEKTIYRAVRLDDGSVLRISVSRATLATLVLGMLQPLLVVLLAALILAAVLASSISKHIVAPLNQIDLEHPLDNDTYEELAPLLTRISQQRRQIDEQVRRLRRKNDEFTQITSNMSEGLVLLNEKGIILNINPAAERLFATDHSCVQQDFLTVERSPEVSRAIKNAFENGYSRIYLTRGEREYQLDISRIASDGAVVGAVLLAFDATEQLDAERSRREFTANVSHELKTPLQSIMGSAELIENGLVKSEDMPRFVGHIRAEAARLVTLIDDIIRLSQLDEGGEMPFDTVDLYAVAEETAAQLRPAADARHIRIEVTGVPLCIQSVRRLVSETVYNLCDNAIKYNVDGGSVTIDVAKQGADAVIRVADTGVGIPPEHQARVFERFYRVDKSHSRQSGGTGLGLSIVKHAVSDLGGRITLESVPGKGTTMQVTLPLG